MRKETGTVHFFVNSIDQGAAASNVPENVYGVIDLYGRASQATIIDQSGNSFGPDTRDFDIIILIACYVPGVTRNKFRKPKLAIWKVSKKHF